MSNNDIRKLSDGDHIRLRTEMYLGSRSPHTQTVINWTGKQLEAQEVTWTPAMYCAFREIFDNALDEVIGHSSGSRIDVSYDESSAKFSVKDDGRGIPIDWDENENMHKATMVLVYPRAGRNFGERGEVRGTNGIGSSATIHCCETSTVTVYRDGNKFTQTFSEPNAVVKDLQVSEPKITKSSGKSGTELSFTLSKSVFKHRILPTSFVLARVYEVAANHPNIKFTFNGEKVTVKNTVEKTFFSDKSFIKIVSEADKFLSTFYLVPNFSTEGEYVHSTVNDIPAFNGGHHIDVFKRVFFSNLLKSLEKESRRRGLTPNRSDIQEGILVYNVTQMHAPNFDSQNKTRLINEDVEAHIRVALDDEKLYKRISRDHKEWIDQIYARCAARTQKKDDAETAKLARKVLRAKVPKLMDATGKDRTKCILLITEGDCVQEDTEIAVFEDGRFTSRKIKDVKINDLVLTHTGSLKPVHNKQAKISSGLEIQTASGAKIQVTPTHRLMVFDKTTQKYGFVEAQNLDKNKHYLIKSLLNLDEGFFEIDDISDFDDEKFNCAISFHNHRINQTTLVSKTSSCGVFNIVTGALEHKQVTDIDPEIHLLVANNF